LIHERNHILHPEESEYEIRRRSDKEYKMITGIKIDTTGYFSYTNKRKTYSILFD